MTKELALKLMERKDVYLTSEGKQALKALLESDKAVTSYVSPHRSL